MKQEEKEEAKEYYGKELEKSLENGFGPGDRYAGLR